jgi:hypothetical protein
MVTLFIATMLGIFLFYYLHLVSTQNNLVARSQAWNTSLTLAEAGVEEALAQLNPGAPAPVIDRTANGWGAVSGGRYGPMTRALTAGSYSVLYTDDKYPIIYSTGYVAVAVLGVTLSRTVQVMTTNMALFPAPMSARYNIDMNGNGIYTDSFNPLDPKLSTNGRYDSAKASTNGTIASFGGIVNVGNANINGKLLLGPSASSVTPKSGGYISGGVYYDFNLDFADVVMPSTLPLGASAGTTTIDGVSYQYVFNSSGYYSIDGLSGSIYVATNANVQLKLTGNASPTSIRVAGGTNNSGNLTLYMTGQTFNLSGGSSVDGGNARSLTYYGTTNNTSITFGANAAFTGCVYAPEANFKLGGGGTDTYDFVGACVVYSIFMNGHYSFHFPEDLPLNGPMTGFVALSWKEL